MSFKASERQRIISKIWERGKKPSRWEIRLDPWHGYEQPPSAEAMADRDRRQAMPDTRSVTGKVMGDPLPGRSALEKKREAERLAKAKRKWWQIEDGEEG